jgi:hypothetical protein
MTGLEKEKQQLIEYLRRDADLYARGRFKEIGQDYDEAHTAYLWALANAAREKGFVAPPNTEEIAWNFWQAMIEAAHRRSPARFLTDDSGKWWNTADHIIRKLEADEPIIDSVILREFGEEQIPTSRANRDYAQFELYIWGLVFSLALCGIIVRGRDVTSAFTIVLVSFFIRLAIRNLSRFL